ncbi:MAG: hypothetical protein KAJ05_04375, partial [Candidatus Latescibacteria bacterium]|nr:hypothetical protein [Candidatus Latescibacterota bacterium]
MELEIARAGFVLAWTLWLGTQILQKRKIQSKIFLLNQWGYGGLILLMEFAWVVTEMENLALEGANIFVMAVIFRFAIWHAVVEIIMVKLAILILNAIPEKHVIIILLPEFTLAPEARLVTPMLIV